MKFRIIFSALLLLYMLTADFALAQRKVLTFEEAVKIALQNSVSLNTQRNNLAYSQAQRLSAITGLGQRCSSSVRPIR